MFPQTSRPAGGAFFEPLESRQLRSVSTLEYVELTNESAELEPAIEMPLETEQSLDQSERRMMLEHPDGSEIEMSYEDWSNIDWTEFDWSDYGLSDPVESDQPVAEIDDSSDEIVKLTPLALVYRKEIPDCWGMSDIQLDSESVFHMTYDPGLNVLADSAIVTTDAEQGPADPALEAHDAALASTNAYEQISEDSSNPDLLEDASDVI